MLFTTNIYTHVCLHPPGCVCMSLALSVRPVSNSSRLSYLTMYIFHMEMSTGHCAVLCCADALLLAITNCDH